MAAFSHYGWWGSAASAPEHLAAWTNQYAAMPSLHVGWAVWAGWLVARHARSQVVQVLGAAYPLVITFVVVATANHYVLDVIAGGSAPVLAAAACHIAHQRRGTRLHGPATSQLSDSRSSQAGAFR